LVIGAGGLLGGAVAGCLASSGRSWIGTSRGGLPGGGGHPAPSGRLRRLDLADRDELRRLLLEVQPRFIVNAASHPPGAAVEQMRRIHLDGSANLLAAVEETGSACRVLLLGSAAEYGNAAAGTRLGEAAPLRPLSDYGRIKAAAGERALARRERGVDLVVARVFNLIGPGQGARLLAGALLAKLARGEQPLGVDDANFVRDWVDVRDVARALVLLAEAAVAPPVVNVCTGTGRRVATLARRLAALAGAAVTPRATPTGPTVLWRSVGAPQRLRALGWQPEVPFARSLVDQWREAGSPRVAGPAGAVSSAGAVRQDSNPEGAGASPSPCPPGRDPAVPRKREGD
jgi:NDP-hexose 4-ketoreductase